MFNVNSYYDLPELQRKLCEMYKRHIESIPLSPVLDGLDVNVDDLFVKLVICDDETHEPRSTNENTKDYNTRPTKKNTKDYYKKVKGYRDIFLRKVNECRNECKHK